jgi:hypothetical protein
MVGDELTDRMNVDEPTGVGLDDIVSSAELFTAADPIRGPIVATLALDALPPDDDLPPWSAVKKDCVDAGTPIAAGYGLAATGEGNVAAPPADVIEVVL